MMKERMSSGKGHRVIEATGCLSKGRLMLKVCAQSRASRDEATRASQNVDNAERMSQRRTIER